MQVITTVRGVITKFHKSHLGTAELERARKELGIKRGLETIGKTRFGSVVRGAKSVDRNIPAVKLVVQRDDFDLDVSDIIYISVFY